MLRVHISFTGVMLCSILVLASLTIISGFILSSTIVHADDNSAMDTLNIYVPVACTMSGNIDTSHTATINNGTYSGASGSEYENGIGKTTLTTFCNDQNGFSIYAIGYTGDEAGNTNLVGTSVSNNATIATGTATSGNTSNWAMKVNKVTDSSTSFTPANMTITNSFDNYKAVPDEYTKVAEYHAQAGSSATDTILGAKVTTTYAAFVSSTQIADTYTGQVKYTMVHPYDAAAPVTPLDDTDCPANSICYAPNTGGIVGSMDSISSVKLTTSPTAGVQSIGSSGTYTLIAPNYSRANYGFAGWSPDFNVTSSSIIYGPNQDIITATDGTGDVDVSTNGLILYPVWVASAGTLQNFSCASSSLITASGSTSTLASVTALTDLRDNNVYAVAKLADGNCWMIENLRMNDAYSANSNLSQGFAASTTYGNFTGLANPENTNFGDSTTANSLYSIDGSTINVIKNGNSYYYGYRFPRYNNNNTNRNLTASYNGVDNVYYQWYAYGNYYTWAAVIADVSHYGIDGSTDDQSVNNTSICPANWHLPTGGVAYASGDTGGVNVTGAPSTYRDYYYLSYVVMGNTTAYEDTANNGQSLYSNTVNADGDTANKAFRRFPNNFLYSGYIRNSDVYSRGTEGNYWTSTVYWSNSADNLYLNNNQLFPGTLSNYKSRGLSVRCMTNS